MVKPAIRVEGLDALRSALRKAGGDMSKDVGRAGKQAAEIVAVTARSRVPVRTGRARASVRAVASLGGGAVQGGGARAPYYPWLEFRGGSGGRYIDPALSDREPDVVDVYERLTAAVLRGSGLI